MPRFKQPTPLENIALESLVTHIVTYCDRLSVKGDLIRLRESIAVIKNHLHDYLPDILFVAVCRKFLKNFYRIGDKRMYDGESEIYYGIVPEVTVDEETTDNKFSIRFARLKRKERPESHHRAVLEILMDVKITGLRCEGQILRFLDPDGTQRLLGLEILDLSKFRSTKFEHLKYFRLQNLTTFICPGSSTDDDLEIIGSCCPKLQVLIVEESKHVTDRGLRGIHSCTELRVINIHYCRTSDSGINEMLSVHNKLEEFNIGHDFIFGEESYEILSREKSLVCPSIKRFEIKSDPVTDEHLNAIVTLFPNLTYLWICHKLTGDIRVLKKLDKLTEFNLSYGYTDVSLDRLKELLTDIGANISFLGLHYCFPRLFISQNDLNFLYQHCGNVESLEFDYTPTKKLDKLVVPPFRRLKNLECVTSTRRNDYRVALDFGQMLQLEKLRIQGFDDIFKMTESMMLDHVKFPNLKDVRTFYNCEDPVRRIMQIAKNNNLDFLFGFSQ